MTRTGRITRWALALVALCGTAAGAEDNGVFVRLRLVEPTTGTYFVRLRGYIHIDPWYLPNVVVPTDADRDAAKRLAAGQWTDWFDLEAYGGARLHGRQQRSGGVAEFPNIAAEFEANAQAPRYRFAIELATAPNPARVVKRFDESAPGNRTSFLVSPHLARDAESLESLSQMQARHVRWAREAAGGRRVSPRQHIIQTGFYGPTIEGGEVLHLLGFKILRHCFAPLRDMVHDCFYFF